MPEPTEQVDVLRRIADWKAYGMLPKVIALAIVGMLVVIAQTEPIAPFACPLS